MKRPWSYSSGSFRLASASRKRGATHRRRAATGGSAAVRLAASAAHTRPATAAPNARSLPHAAAHTSGSYPSTWRGSGCTGLDARYGPTPALARWAAVQLYRPHANFSVTLLDAPPGTCTKCAIENGAGSGPQVPSPPRSERGSEPSGAAWSSAPASSHGDHSPDHPLLLQDCTNHRGRNAKRSGAAAAAAAASPRSSSRGSCRPPSPRSASRHAPENRPRGPNGSPPSASGHSPPKCGTERFPDISSECGSQSCPSAASAASVRGGGRGYDRDRYVPAPSGMSHPSAAACAPNHWAGSRPFSQQCGKSGRPATAERSVSEYNDCSQQFSDANGCLPCTS
eukprot:359409-Chlamydomonas_euryale.AAC.4